MLAKAFGNFPHSNALIFASGVANSSETRRSEFTREVEYLKKCCAKYPYKKLLYFSSYTAKNGSSPYACHKRNIENLIPSVSRQFLIFRLPQIVGFTNNNTLFNYLVKTVCRNEKLVVHRNAFRSLLDVVDLVRIVSLIVNFEEVNKIIPIGPAQPMSIIEILERIEQVLGRKADVRFEDAGDYQSASLEIVVNLIGCDDPILRHNYQSEVIAKYASKIMASEIR